MIRFTRMVVVAVVALILITFAFANRQIVIVSFDPTNAPESSALATRAPLFAVVIVTAMLGVIAGSSVTWLSQGRHRREARLHKKEARKWRAEAEALKAQQPPALPRS